MIKLKRKNNLYQNICKIENIESAYNEVCKNTKNKNRVANLKSYKSIYLFRTYFTLVNKNYIVGPYNKFTIYEPKKREIVSQNLEDKIINHLVARYILYPALLPCLLDINVASRKGMGTSKGLAIEKKYRQICFQKYKVFYILKCDVQKFFASINHDILKTKLLKRIKDVDALKIVFDIIDSNEHGLYIGSMTNQILAIFYLNDLDHYVKEVLKIKYYVRYQDDFLLFHPSKEYLQFCLQKISNFLQREKLTLNKKTRLYKSTNNFLFLGRDINGKYCRYRNVKRKLRHKYYLYAQNYIHLYSISSSLNCYKHLTNRNLHL